MDNALIFWGMTVAVENLRNFDAYVTRCLNQTVANMVKLEVKGQVEQQSAGAGEMNTKRNDNQDNVDEQWEVQPVTSNTLNDEHFWDSYVSSWENSENKSKYEFLGNEWKHEEKFLEMLEKYSSAHMDALEIGCGGGRITSFAAPLFRNVFATDISNNMLQKCSNSVTASNVSYTKTDGFTLDGFSSSSVDLVFSHDVFVHISALQVYPYLIEIRRVLGDGGIAIISFFNYEKHLALFKEYSLAYHNAKSIPPHMRVHFVTEQIIRLMLDDLGLSVVETDNSFYLIFVVKK